MRGTFSLSNNCDFISGYNLLFQMGQNDLPLAISPSLQEIPLFPLEKNKIKNNCEFVIKRYRILGGKASI